MQLFHSIPLARTSSKRCFFACKMPIKPSSTTPASTTTSTTVTMATSSVFPTPVTQEEFNLFHSIDRNLYARLIIDLGRDPGESMQIIALWIWLERLTHEQIISKILSLPLTLVNALADEAVVCLNCVELDDFPHSVDNNIIPLLQSLLKMEVSLCFFHENRLQTVRGVTKIVNDVCSRAFQDIVMRTFYVGSNQLINPMMNIPVFYPTFGVFPNMTTFEFGESSNKLGASNAVFTPQVTVGGNVLFEPYDLDKQRRVLNTRDVAEVFKGLTISSHAELQEEKEVPVPPKDRTIFITFSKGYPLSETEVRDFFTRKFGDCIEAIHMQEVEGNEQVLYARLVVRSSSTIQVVLGGEPKAKFTINGKHVWARKYICKSPSSSSAEQS